ncbi:DUF1178 family protein [Oleispirillum naphthae]|uniref:DUF1178 family protein n=1 Tax=Oleispirillum naphthae TaxID=2838853 RepID=UPI0030826A83
MIRFALKCACGHRFDSWFRDNRAYEGLSAAGRIACPACGGGEVAKAPMAPSLAAAREEGADAAVRLRSLLLGLRDTVESNCEDVGSAFAEEARKIHYGEAPARGIYGEASAEEANALVEEEITFARLPWISRGDS